MSEEGRGDGSKLPRHTSRALEKSDKVMRSRLRTDHVLRRKIIICACVVPLPGNAWIRGRSTGSMKTDSRSVSQGALVLGHCI
jgi:hypothetical protein